MAKVIPIVRIVDDDETFCMSQKMFLQAMGWFVLIYNSAKTFLEDDDPSQPGCLILDMRMPEMTGLELQTALVARGAPLPIIFLTLKTVESTLSQIRRRRARGTSGLWPSSP